MEIMSDITGRRRNDYRLVPISQINDYNNWTKLLGYLVDDDAVKTGNVASLTKGVDESITLELMKDR